MNETIYIALLWACPVLLGILAFIGTLAIKAFIKMREDLNEIKTAIVKDETRHDALTDRVAKIERRLKWAS